VTKRFRVLAEAGVYDAPRPGTINHWTENLRAAHLSVGTYSIPAGGIDDQGPHSEDELYIVATGNGTLHVDGHQVPVEPGTVVFVAAHALHYFTDIAEDLTVLVVFAPPYTGRG
jgi:mannose-6-phosphate isomerase-like protein (cupin superfamily)